MRPLAATAATVNSRGENIVERPRASDAIGVALRGAFERDTGLPNDMMRLLHRLDTQQRGLRGAGSTINDRG